MNMQLAKDLGFLGINVDSGFDLAWLKTEVADKIAHGDKMGVYRLVNFARHSEDEKVRDYAYKLMQVYKFEIDDYDGTGVKEEDKPFDGDKAETAEEVIDDINAAIEAGEDIKIEITKDIDLTSGSITGFSIPDGATAEFRLDKGTTLKCTKEGFKVGQGSNVTLSGGGTIEVETANSNSAIKVDANAELTIDGITIDGVKGKEDKLDNWVYGIYAVNSSTINFKSGCIKVGGASCISTNNTTGGSTINISGGELLAKNGYALYIPAQGEVNITGGTVQGINARMGTINISGNARIIETGIDDTNCEPIGSNFNASGSIALGDTITLIAGTYTDPNGVDTIVNISGNATVKSKYRSAIGVYAVDTKQKSTVTVDVADGSKVSTTDAGFQNVVVYDHEYISQEATAAGKTYTPKVDSEITVTVAGEVVYPVVDSGTVVTPEGPTEQDEF